MKIEISTELAEAVKRGLAHSVLPDKEQADTFHRFKAALDAAVSDTGMPGSGVGVLPYPVEHQLQNAVRELRTRMGDAEARLEALEAEPATAEPTPHGVAHITYADRFGRLNGAWALPPGTTLDDCTWYGVVWQENDGRTLCFYVQATGYVDALRVAMEDGECHTNSVTVIFIGEVGPK